MSHFQPSAVELRGLPWRIIERSVVSMNTRAPFETRGKRLVVPEEVNVCRAHLGGCSDHAV